MAFAPDGQLFAWGVDSGSVSILETGDLLANGTDNNNLGLVTAVVFSLDGSLIVTTFPDGSVRAWTTTKAVTRCILTVRHDGLTGVVISPDSSRLGPSGSSHSVKIISLLTGECCLTLLKRDMTTFSYFRLIANFCDQCRERRDSCVRPDFKYAPKCLWHLRICACWRLLA